MVHAHIHCSGYWSGNQKERGHLEDPGVDGRTILRWIFKNLDVRGMDGIELAVDRDSWEGGHL
jgi:hypothetical protein